jgi:hypothetical protein
MNTSIESDKSPLFYKCYLSLKRWHNRSSDHNEPLISAAFLGRVNQALAICESWKDEQTLCVLGEDYRLVDTYFWVSDTFAQWRSGRDLLLTSLDELSAKWDEVLAEARERLGNKFLLDDYPAPSALGELWKADLKWRPEETVTSLTLLGEFSAFFERPRPPDIFDSIAWCRELEKQMAKPPGERKTPPFPLPPPIAYGGPQSSAR